MSDPTTPPTTPPTHLDPQVFVDYLGRTRWFAGKGRPFAVSAIRRIGILPGQVEGPPTVAVHLVELTYSDVAADAPDAVELYQVPLAFYTDPEPRLDHAFIGWWEEPGLGWVHAYDALHDRRAMAGWLRSFHQAASRPGGNMTDERSTMAFHRLPGHELDTDVHSTLFSGEQSNSSVAYGEDSLMKVFRKVTVGVNPDIQVHEVLTRSDSDKVAALYGWLDWMDETADGGTGAVVQLAMLQQFLRTASDGWDLALSSVRNLFADPELHAHEVGGDFAGEATRLGEALREIHALLAEQFPTRVLGAEETAGIGAAMTARLEAATAVQPGLAAHAAGLRAAYDRVASLGEVEVQRVHGDLHLGQTLRTAKGWKIVDFEGEPAKPLHERLLPDSPWRDVAGMLRSFDYAPRVVERQLLEEDPSGAEQRSVRAAEWAHRSRNHFLTAYSGGDMSEAEHVLLAAYLADKAVYETVYETRNRPAWVDIPLAAVAEIGAA
ncbi:maltokinase N-terminal cap-like domain-containing protein [Nocardioides kribbensis]|uniref:maltokinase N-terminal cap-like domain-containing protein n=1 Tax=Nocardioides kribbensis TaxID=305517 RepID=UPI0032DAD1A7